MRIGRMVTGSSLEAVVHGVAEAERAGFATAWVPQIFGWDALTVLALGARDTSTIELGTAVIPVHSRHPLSLAAAALSVATASGGRFVLGIGPSHKMVVEDMWGYRYDRPRAYTRDYLAALLPALAGEPVDVATDLVTARSGPLDIPPAPCPPVLIAALAPRMLELAGRTCAGTVTMLTGPRTIRDHIVPSINRAAQAAGRPAPRVVVGLVACVTDDPAGARDRARQASGLYGQLPAYRRMLDREGATDPGDVAVVGSAAQVQDQLAEYAAAGATDLCVLPLGTPDEEEQTGAVLLASEHVG